MKLLSNITKTKSHRLTTFKRFYSIENINKDNKSNINSKPYISSSHCNYCGSAYDNQSWPRVCGCCKNMTFRNPIPVAVGLLPFKITKEKCGLLLVRRSIKPFVGELCFPGGFIDWGESWQQAISREVREETSVQTDPNEFKLETIHSTPDGTRVLIFGSTQKIREYSEIKDFKATNETSELLIGNDFSKLCFSLHQEVLNNWFSNQNE